MDNTVTDSHLVILLDRSGSMSQIRTSMESALNGLIDEQKTVDAPCKVTLVQFSSEAETVFCDKPLKEVGPISLDPAGMTALYDAVGMTLNMLKSKDSDTTSTTIVIITDGEENSSKEYRDPKVIQGLIEEGEDRKWNFIFLGANLDAFKQAKSLGATRSVGNAVTFGLSDMEVAASARGLSKKLLNSRVTGERVVAYTQSDYLTSLATEGMAGDSPADILEAINKNSTGS